MQANRRHFLKTTGIITAGALLPTRLWAVGTASQINIVQLVYPGGNWRPRPNALRRLAWEVHKRTAVDTSLEPTTAKLSTYTQSSSPLAYLSGDRSFPDWNDNAIRTMTRFLRLGGTLIVDPAYTSTGNTKGFEASFDRQVKKILPGIKPRKIAPGHVIYRTFYQIARPMGRLEGPPELMGYEINERLAIIRTKHDLGGAWSRDNLGNWEFSVTPGGERQRENAFRLGVNLVMYALCLDYKNEEPHRRFSPQLVKD